MLQVTYLCWYSFNRDSLDEGIKPVDIFQYRDPDNVPYFVATPTWYHSVFTSIPPTCITYSLHGYSCTEIVWMTAVSWLIYSNTEIQIMCHILLPPQLDTTWCLHWWPHCNILFVLVFPFRDSLDEGSEPVDIFQYGDPDQDSIGQDNLLMSYTHSYMKKRGTVDQGAVDPNR